MAHYQSRGTVHEGTTSRFSGRFVAKCNGRTQVGTPTDKAVTCKRCIGKTDSDSGFGSLT